MDGYNLNWASLVEHYIPFYAMVIRWTGSEHALTPRQRPCPNIIIKYYPTIPYFEYISIDSFTLHTHVFAQFGSTAYRGMSIASQ